MGGVSKQALWLKGVPGLIAIWWVGAVVDRVWFALDRTVPAWDQADYLNAALTYWRVLQTPDWFSMDWWVDLWQLSTKLPPLVFISTAPFLSLFGTGADQSTLVNLLYSAILLGSVYTLGWCLFSVPVGLWAAGICLLMPGLYRVRLDYLLDYPLAAVVTLSFTCLTLWREQIWQERRRPAGIAPGKPLNRSQVMKAPFSAGGSLAFASWSTGLPWLLALVAGLTLGLALLVKQTTLLFLLVPILWVAVESFWYRAWGRLLQWALALFLAGAICYPWYRTNWLLLLTGSKRATIDAAIAEGDPSLLSLDAWTFYLKLLPGSISLPLFLIPLLGFVLFWRSGRVSSQWAGRDDYAPKSRDYREQRFCQSQQAIGWLLVFWVGAYFLCSFNINKDSRYTVPYLPVIAVMLAYGLTLLPRSWSILRWGSLGLSGLILLVGVSPFASLGLNQQSLARHPISMTGDYPHAAVVAAVAQAEPYLQATIGVLPSTPEINQHNVNYYGMLHNFQVHGRQVGTRMGNVEADRRSLGWMLTKTDSQGAIRRKRPQKALVKAIEAETDFQLQQTWELPDRTSLKLYRQRVPEVEVKPLVAASTQEVEVRRQDASIPPLSSPALSPIRLDRLILPSQAPPGKPVPVTYEWSGSWEALQPGLVLLNWRKQAETAPGQGVDRWLHDHGIGLGFLHPEAVKSEQRSAQFQVIERLAMLPPKQAEGIYTLEATYLNRQTGETAIIPVPPVQLNIVATAPALPAPEVDLVTQLRDLAANLPYGRRELDQIFEEVGRISQYDPTQDYVNQTWQAMDYRLQQEPNNLKFAYTLALANVLKQRVDPAIAALERVVTLDSQNPYAYAYLAFANLYDFRTRPAQSALNKAMSLDPTLPELKVLNGVAGLLRGNLVQAWQGVQAVRSLEQQDK
ncbi:phospholipid carrier-dependent glycosyltransferase [Pantanalinema sp. GBBB05]|uniref:phospholipid carrier-dependent glycosyltransferase n=1 Tax=Pantanalinema sp. GBBB05 TaxID=2604139 RepID=UPI001DEA0FF3|nr:phospholipid carrier-dependent glycosyltransferase [Pantanalinema sp. GBBB05]